MFFTKKKIVLISLFSLIGIILFVLDFYGIIWHNQPIASLYPINGLDVSHYQGTIDWSKVTKSKKYSFVYIKATEGHDFIDSEFSTNWKNAQFNGLLVGAYHFFSTRSSGIEQANFFISNVPNVSTALPPAIDIEIDIHQNPQLVQTDLKDLITKLQDYYHKKPILYVTYDTYNAYIKGKFDQQDIWIRDIVKFPFLNRSWLIWQYGNRSHIPGINSFVDVNVYNGNSQQLQNFVLPLK